MKMWACAYQYDEDYFYDFAKGEDSYDIEPTQLLPTKELAEQMIQELLSDDYVPVEIEIHSYNKNGVMSYTIGKVERWANDGEWGKEGTD